MVGSPNYVFFIYDGDDSDATGAGPGPPGSAQIEKTFEAFFTSRGLPFKGTDFSGRSDYGPFIAAGIPSGGLFTGAEGIKTRRRRQPSGVVPPARVRPLLPPGLRHATRTTTTSRWTTTATPIALRHVSYAMSTELINGTKSKGNFKPPADVGAAIAA